MSTFQPSTLLRAQNAFLKNLARLRNMMATLHPDWILTLAEGGVDRVRKGHPIDKDGKPAPELSKYSDAVHMPESKHYVRLAVDLNLFIPVDDKALDYRQVVDSGAPEWVEIHALWEHLDPMNRFMPEGSADANHLSRAVDAQDKRI